ncbi:MAG: hypothetical protein WCV81_05425 [Microgenomates group bacterium]|jgi:chromosome segregation ATPase
MDDTQKMLQVIINGQSSLKQELTTRIDKLDEKLSGRIDKLDQKLTNRIDKLGKQLAYLEDDAPTREEHDVLKKRVDKIEKTIVAA